MRPPIQSESVREYMRVELMKGGDPHLKFDGTNPDDFWGWHDEITRKLSAAGFDIYPVDTIHALRVHTDKRPKELVSAYINAGIDDPASVLDEIWRTLVSRYGSNDVVASSVTRKLETFRVISHEDDTGAMETMEDLQFSMLFVFEFVGSAGDVIA